MVIRRMTRAGRLPSGGPQPSQVRGVHPGRPGRNSLNEKRPRAALEIIEVVLGPRRMRTCFISRVYTPRPEETPSIKKHGARRMAPCTVKVYVRTNTACARPLLFIGDTPTPGADPRRQEPSDNKKSMEPNLLPYVGSGLPCSERSRLHASICKDTQAWSCF